MTQLQGRTVAPRPAIHIGITSILLLLAVSGVLMPMRLLGAQSPELLSPLAGKVVLVDFWASWCVPCRRSFPWMNAMQRKYGSDGLVILAVNLDNDREQAERFLADYPATFRVHYDEDRSLARDFEVSAMPSSFVVGRDGLVRAQHRGFRSSMEQDYEAAIRAALEEHSP